jgi:hypothetical protein
VPTKDTGRDDVGYPEKSTSIWKMVDFRLKFTRNLFEARKLKDAISEELMSWTAL